MKITNLTKKAKRFGRNAHDSISHKRKYTNEPYYVHPERVAEIVSSVTSDEEVIAAAFLHDVLEDVAPFNPSFNEEVIERNFGKRVLQLTLEITDISKPEDGNRTKRKEIDRAHLAQASPEAQTIKLADLIDNIIDISKHDPNQDLPYLKLGNKKLFEQLVYLLNEG